MTWYKTGGRFFCLNSSKDLAKKTEEPSLCLTERNEISEQAVEEIEPMMRPYRNRSTTWDYRSASALIYEAFRLYDIPLSLYRESESGRPYIADGRGDISVSHSGHFTVVAITDNPDISIGIDIEEIERARHRDVIAIAKRFFAESEFEQVKSSRDPVIRFLQLWTGKEAAMKAFRVPLTQTLRGGEAYTEASRGISVTPALSGRIVAAYASVASKQ